MGEPCDYGAERRAVEGSVIMVRNVMGMVRLWCGTVVSLDTLAYYRGGLLWSEVTIKSDWRESVNSETAGYA